MVLRVGTVSGYDACRRRKNDLRSSSGSQNLLLAFTKKNKGQDGWRLSSDHFSMIGDDNGEMEMQLMEVEIGQTKSDLILQGFEVRPKQKVVGRD